MEFVRIVLAAVAAAILYGVAHDQVTVRVSLEYFTVGHPPLFVTGSPSLLALFWGVAATWWVGLPLGFLLASAARNGRSWPLLGLREVLPKLGALLGGMALLAIAAGAGTYLLAGPFNLQLPDPLAALVPVTAHRAFLAVWAAHVTSYIAGVAGSLLLALRVVRERKARAAEAGGNGRQRATGTGSKR